MDSSNVTLLQPTRLVSTSNGALRDHESGIVTLANGGLPEGSSKQASITFDYGHCIGGIPSFLVDRASGDGPINVRILYSETMEGIERGTGRDALLQPLLCLTNTISKAMAPTFSSPMLWTVIAMFQ